MVDAPLGGEPICQARVVWCKALLDFVTIVNAADVWVSNSRILVDFAE